MNRAGEIEALVLQKQIGPVALEAHIRTSAGANVDEDVIPELTSEILNLKEILMIACNDLIRDLERNPDISIFWGEKEYSATEMLAEVRSMSQVGKSFAKNFLNAKNVKKNDKTKG